MHGGEVSGFTAENMVFPDDRAAVVVLTNQDAARASGELARRVSAILFTVRDAATAAKTEQARKIFEGLQHGNIERSLFTENANSYFDEQALKDFASGLGPLGAPVEFSQTREALRGGMTLRVYRIRFPQQFLRAWTYEMPDGKLEQYQVSTE
jgi:D-alanyl-D-alanine carboxypeptidase